jgi:kinetochore protein NDC80
MKAGADKSSVTAATDGPRTRLSLASRQSMGAATNANRQSLGGRSLHTGKDTTSNNNNNSNASTAVSRTSMSGRRSSTHSRPSSLHSSASSVRSDPRPMHDKSYLKEQINKIIVYCTTHHYDRPLSPKLLLSPSAKDFKHLMLFLFIQVDPNFAFGSSVEDDIKRYMKLLGYPFSISKNALQAAGTPHTWPALLLMMAWIVDFLVVSSHPHTLNTNNTYSNTTAF